jgi:hypothetical protein
MTNKDLEIGGLYHYLTPRRIVFFGPQGEILISGKEDELIQANEPFVLLEIIRKNLISTFRFKILSSKGILGYIDARLECVLKFNGETT